MRISDNKKGKLFYTTAVLYFLVITTFIFCSCSVPVSKNVEQTKIEAENVSFFQTSKVNVTYKDKQINTIDISDCKDRWITDTAFKVQGMPKMLELPENTTDRLKYIVPWHCNEINIHIWAMLNGEPVLKDVYDDIPSPENTIKLPQKKGKYAINIIINNFDGSRIIKSLLLKVGDGKTEDFTKTDLLPFYFYNKNNTPFRSYAHVTRFDDNFNYEVYRPTEISDHIIKMEFVPLNEIANPTAINIPRPFKVEFEFGKRKDTFVFTKEKVVINGIDYYPKNSSAVATMFIEDYSGLLTKDFFLMSKIIPFNADEVEHIEKKTILMEGELINKIYNKQDITQCVEEYKYNIIRELKPGEPPSAVGGGSGGYYTVFFLNNGKEFTVSTICSLIKVTDSNKKYDLADNGSKRILLENKLKGRLPTINVNFNGKSVKVDDYNYSWQNNLQQYYDDFPDVWHPTERAILSPNQDNYFEFSLSQKPDNVMAYFQKPIAGTKANDYRTTYAEPVKLTVQNGNKVLLPKELGDYYIVVKAEYATDWVEYASFFEIQ